MNRGGLDRSKIRPEHLERAAFVYVRQSSLKQVRENVESQRRQYGFAEQARALGWSEGQIVILDEDQGRSGAAPEARPGFGRLVGAVARTEVGIVMSLEVSRLSRNDSDWHHLVHLCRWTATLIADEHGVYDPTSTADRLVLGIRGQVSELERDSSVHRMVEARWAKARRGEVFTVLPAGYDVDRTGQVTKSSDETVTDAITRVFEKFDELGTARQVFVWWQEQGLPFPARQTESGDRGVAWVSVSYRGILQVLHHPFYAGAYVFGRTETRRELDPENVHRLVVRRGKRSREDWPVLIRDHHPGYISFAKYLENQDRIRDNEVMGSPSDESHKGAPREGRALLQGLVRCGHCGRRMMVGYGGNRARRTLQYRCRRPGEYGRRECQLVGGKRIEAAVVETFLEVTAGAGEEAAALADEQLRGEIAAAEKTWQLQIEKADYEARRAERQYMAVEPENRFRGRSLEEAMEEEILRVVEPGAVDAALKAAETVTERSGEQLRTAELELEHARYGAERCFRQSDTSDPENRLVTGELERRWNEALGQVEELEQRLAPLRDAQVAKKDFDRDCLLALAADLPRVWSDPHSDMRLKKRIVRTLVEEIIVDLSPEGDTIHAVIHWKGGVHSTRGIRKRKSGQHRHVAAEKTAAIIAQMAEGYSDEQIAFTLNRVRLRTGKGLTWRADRVRSYRSYHQLPAYNPEVRAEQLTLKEAATRLGVCTMTVRRLIGRGIIPASQPAPGVPWIIKRSVLEEPSVQRAITASKNYRPRTTSRNRTNLRIPGT